MGDHTEAIAAVLAVLGLIGTWICGYVAGPCFDTQDQAIAYRDSLDREGVKWRPQR